MLYSNGKFSEIINALTHSLFNTEEGGHLTPPVYGNKMLLEDTFDMLLENDEFMVMEG